ncbi:hypothetical protein BDV95DRAFT_494990 [Massariosphaeria phaeospora]|uniref:Uncharacterized protein n=1 Tax=Massariosphaeria phaeospora TaxID=100035 RepID=A0A7C8I539_9PLEO|nr:hypothetical protein BDV95DRAFT_494990 [Massariosphaeria phaeospora]
MLQGSKTPDPKTQTQFTLITGSAPGGDGTIPDVYIKNKDGNQLAHFHDEDGHLDNEAFRSFTVIDIISTTDSCTLTYVLAYVTLLMKNIDAICLSGIMANGNGGTYTWTGDMAEHCGAEWYASRFTFSGSNYPPKCMWLDSDGTNKIVAKGLTIHMPDFLGESGLIDQYRENDDLLCKSTKRMVFWPQDRHGVDFETFQPRLEYNSTGAIINANDTIDNFAECRDHDKGCRQERGYPDGTTLWWREGENKKRNHPRDFAELPNSNPYPDHITVSHMEGHSARELCESLTSRGADFIAINGKEKLFCDMAKKQLFDVCDAEVTTACFDYETMAFRDVGAKIRKRDLSYGDTIPERSYMTNEVWR